MTVTANDTVERFTVDGTGPYPFSFRIFDASDLVVHVLSGSVSTLLSLSTHYTVSGEDDQSGGSLSLTTDAATTYDGYTLDVRSQTPLSQPSAIRNQASLRLSSIETALDRLSRQIQDQDRRLSQAIRFPDPLLVDGEMTPIANWLERYPYINSSGALEPAASIAQTTLTQSIIAGFLFPQTTEESNAGIVPSDNAYEYGDPRRYGAVGDGSTDDSTAWQKIATLGFGRIPDNFSMKIVTGATKTGRVDIRGSGKGSKILCDTAFLTVTDGTDSIVDNLWAENITAPWIITRDPGDWDADISGTLQQSNADGYQPTVNDSDIWSSLTTGQQNQNIGPVLRFTGDAENIVVSRIYGRFVLVDILDAQRSSVVDCDFRAGKGVWGGIVFNNDASQEGRFNRAVNNVVRYSSFSGINFKNNFDGLASGNLIELCGESGIKTNANDGVTSLTNCTNMTLTNNKCHKNYFDGMDLLTSYPATDAIAGSFIVSDNDCYGNGGTGINADGKYNQYRGNKIWLNNRQGFWGYCSYSLIDGNTLIDNNQERNASQPEMLAGDPSTSGNNTIVNNKIISGATQNSAAIYADGPNHTILNNVAVNSSFVFGSTGVHENNTDASTGQITTQSFTLLLFNNGGTFQHQIISEYVGNAIGNKSYKINGASATLSNTPTGTDASTAFVTGVKIGSASPNTIYFDTAAQTSANFDGVAAIATLDAGQPLHVMAQFSSININGVTRSRLSFVLTKNDGTAYNINTTNFTAGKGLRIQFRGMLA